MTPSTKPPPPVDDGMAAAKYGQEYFYTKKITTSTGTEDISSGVASWEPGMGGDENPHREMMSYFNRNTMGPYDFSSVELPLGEMFYPSPSVGYSRVEVRSIHGGDTVKNAAAVQVTDFYTTKDFPTKSNYTPLDEHGATDKYKPSPILQLFKIDINTSVALSQGFKVDLNDINGKMKKQSSYSRENLNDPISYTENFYNIVKSGNNTYKFNHLFPVLTQSDGVIDNSIIGRDIELMSDFRQHKLETISTTVDFNIDVINGCFIPIPIFTMFSPVQNESDTYKSAAVLKIVNHYSILDSVVSVDKGSMVSTKNLVYDAETGNALLTRTNNEFNHPVYGFSYPAHLRYIGMDLAYKNIDATYDGVVFKNGRIESGIADMSIFESGDEIYVLSTEPKGPTATDGCDLPTPTNAAILDGKYVKSLAKKIWVIKSEKVKSMTPELFFIDAGGEPYTADQVTMRIIRSGKRNMLGSSVGSMTMLNNPLQKIGTTTKLVIDAKKGILQTSASTFRDHWRVDDVLFNSKGNCLSKFDKRRINPYVEGVWGNWRPDSTFVYYGEREEQHPTPNLDMRQAGIIRSAGNSVFKPFWKFASDRLSRNTENGMLWSWTSEITQYNRKGYDIENKDPLGKFNASLYGYHQQLPVAVVNNSRLRESMFDGFEDYDYQSNLTNSNNCTLPRHADFGTLPPSVSISPDQYHTGKSSLKIGSNTTLNLTVPVVEEKKTEDGYFMRVRVDSVPRADTTLLYSVPNSSPGIPPKIVKTPTGNGWGGTYYQLNKNNYIGNADIINCPQIALDAQQRLNLGGIPSKSYNRPDLNWHYHPNEPNTCDPTLSGCTPAEYYTVRWQAWLQPAKSSYYVFFVDANDGVKLTLRNQNNLTPESIDIRTIDRFQCFHIEPTISSYISEPVHLLIGEKYLLNY